MSRAEGTWPRFALSAKLVVVLSLFALVACATPAVQPGTQPIGGAYTVETPIDWRRHDESDKSEIWTSRGPREDQLVFVTGLAPGEALIPELKTFPRYQAGMTPEAIAQFVVNSYVLHGGHTNAATGSGRSASAASRASVSSMATRRGSTSTSTRSAPVRSRTTGCI